MQRRVADFALQLTQCSQLLSQQVLHTKCTFKSKVRKKWNVKNPWPLMDVDITGIAWCCV